MPTAYTVKIKNGEITKLKDYILGCAKNFGALSHMRDESIYTPIECRKVDDYHSNRLKEINKQLEDFSKLTDEEIQSEINNKYEQQMKDKQEGLKDFEENKQRYLHMIEKVKEWNPPTSEHNQLKQFAIEQLESSLNSDCSDWLRKSYLTEPTKMEIHLYKNLQITDFLESIEYHSRKLREEIEAVSDNNKWIDDLINSFE